MKIGMLLEVTHNALGNSDIVLYEIWHIWGLLKQRCIGALFSICSCAKGKMTVLIYILFIDWNWISKGTSAHRVLCIYVMFSTEITRSPSKTLEQGMLLFHGKRLVFLDMTLNSEAAVQMDPELVLSKVSCIIIGYQTGWSRYLNQGRQFADNNTLQSASLSSVKTQGLQDVLEHH